MAKTRDVLLFLREYYESIHRVVADYADRADWRVHIAPRRLPPRWYGDGVITDCHLWEQLEGLRDRRDIPIVSCYKGIDKPNVRQVCVDPDDLVSVALEYLHGKGYENFAGYDARHVDLHTADRFEELARTSGFNVDSYRWTELMPQRDFEEIVRTTQKFLRDLPKPCALYLGHFIYVYHVCRAAEEEGIDIPEEVAVLSRTEQPLVTDRIRPTVSTLGPWRSMVFHRLCETLEDMMDGKDVPRRTITVKPYVIERQSTNMLAVPHLPTARAITFIRENCDRPITIAQISREVGSSQSALRENFNKYLKTSPQAFLKNARLNRARELLESTDWSLEAIARRTGYGSGMALHSAFKKHFGITPGRHRAVTKSTNKTRK